MTELRNRIVKETNGEQFVSGVLITHDEIGEALDWEVQLHEATGWTVEQYGAMIRCTKGQTVRWVWVRSKPPMEDTL